MINQKGIEYLSGKELLTKKGYNMHQYRHAWHTVHQNTGSKVI